MREIFAADSNVRLAPPGFRVRTIAVPFSGMQDYDGSAGDGDALAAFELDGSASVADVEKLVFPVREGAPLLPREVVVGRVVFVRIRLAGQRRLVSGPGHIEAETPLYRAYRAVVDLVHAADSTISGSVCVKKLKSCQIFILNGVCVLC